MAMVKKPVTGMKDILPVEMQIRDYVIGLIKETYKGFGFTSIETPCVEHIENLCSNQGGDNEKLIFKILKRGEKLNVEAATTEEEVVDSGLRYDLTLPLSRYYSNNANQLPSPFKALQIGSVFRAERPQKGRFRQFTQCDIDILGDASVLAEIELITATTTLLGKLFSKFTIRINDRRILRAMADYSGFPEESYEKIFIILDKMDKIGLDGVKSELEESGFASESIEKYVELFTLLENEEKPVAFLREKLGSFLDDETATSLETIMDSVNATKACDFGLVFDPTLVRGMSYYTGTIFEISMPGFSGSVGGGGRYDKMIGKFTGKETCACGFSIGFERIISILLDQNFKVPQAGSKVAYLIEKKMPNDKLCEILKQAAKERATGKQILVVTMNKNKKFQKEQLTKEGYEEFVEFFNR
ncbi:Histidyl-tRNA synthetase [Lachnospiraceae bacterium TWA4]|nr:Histidyl-tRNA synthetase [Lachnospiraceae bacterium TWA4]